MSYFNFKTKKDAIDHAIWIVAYYFGKELGVFETDEELWNYLDSLDQDDRLEEMDKWDYLLGK